MSNADTVVAFFIRMLCHYLMVCVNCEIDRSTLIFTSYKFFHNTGWREKLRILGLTEEIVSAWFLRT